MSRGDIDWAQLLRSMAALPYGGEPVDQLAHSLQCARLAADVGADDDLIVAAGLHDVGRAPEVITAYPSLPHEGAGARFCAAQLNDRVAYLVGQHVQAKRFLVTTDREYHDRLTAVSKATFRTQGATMSPGEVDAFQAHPWHADAVALRRWDDQAKTLDAPTMPVAGLLTVIARVQGAAAT